MDCQETRLHLLEYQRGRLAPELSAEVHAHLESCAACGHTRAVEQALTELLEERVPQYPARPALKRRLAARWPSAPAVRRSWWGRWGRSLVPALAVGVILIVTLPIYYERVAIPKAQGTARLVGEAVNNHLRILSSERPLEIQGGGMHQVKPWFSGRLDFAPVVSFVEDHEFPLRGGAVGYFVDRKAAVFVYRRRLHTISLFVFRAEGFAWPARGLEPMGSVQVYSETARGFNVLLWRAGELGYALVSDLNSAELFDLGLKISGGS